MKRIGDRIQDRFGFFGVYICFLAAAVALVAWLILSMMFIWPSVAPIIIAAWMAYHVRDDK